MSPGKLPYAPTWYSAHDQASHGGCRTWSPFAGMSSPSSAAEMGQGTMLLVSVVQEAQLAKLPASRVLPRQPCVYVLAGDDPPPAGLDRAETVSP
jgi:hypothetical protein